MRARVALNSPFGGGGIGLPAVKAESPELAVSRYVAVFIGIVGRQLYPTAHLTKSAAENIFITLSTNVLPPLVAGVVMAGILAATISSSDSYLLIAASAFAKNIYQISA